MNGLPLGSNHVANHREPKKLTRRQLFVRGAVAAGGLMITGAVLRYAWFLEAAPRAGLRMLTAREVEILKSVLLAFFPGAEGMPPADLDFLVPKIDAFLAHNDPEARSLFRAMLHVIDDHARFFHLSRFVDLSPEAQAAEVRAWELTPIYLKKAAFRSVKLIIGMHYMDQPDVRPAMGWYLGCSPSHLVPSNAGGAGV
jgi:hypothetical protein